MIERIVYMAEFFLAAFLGLLLLCGVATIIPLIVYLWKELLKD